MVPPLVPVAQKFVENSTLIKLIFKKVLGPKVGNDRFEKLNLRNRLFGFYVLTGDTGFCWHFKGVTSQKV